MQELSKILETSLGGYSLSRILSAVLTLLVCLIVSRLLLKLAKRLLDRSKKAYRCIYCDAEHRVK